MTIEETIASFRWYHEIQVAPGIRTVPVLRFDVSWWLIDQNMPVTFDGLRVLDIGTRDGKYAFRAECAGASAVVAIDNDQSQGALWLKEHFKSKVEFRECNLYDFTDKDGFDVILFFGVLYHLRYPMNGLARISKLLKPGGQLYIETGVLDRNNEFPLLHLPSRHSPYESTSCSFFNRAGIDETLWSFGITMTKFVVDTSEKDNEIRRAWIEGTKTHEMPEELTDYWGGIHKAHN